MSEELFPENTGAQESPRLRWIKAHNCITFYSPVEPAVWYAGFAILPVEDNAQWICDELGANGNVMVGEGATEDEAIAEAALKSDIKLWNEETPL